VTRAVSPHTEESLDPEDWHSLRQLGHRMIDDMMTYLEEVDQRPVWQPIPDEVKTRLRAPLPLEPQDLEKVYEKFVEDVLPYPMGCIHPRFWGWALGTGTPLDVLAEMLAAGMNSNTGGGEHVANYVEAQVLNWLKEMLGYPIEASGLLVSGASMANLIGLTVARNALAGFNVRRQGVSASPQKKTIYASTETHSSVQKAIELLGLGADSLSQIPVNSDFQIELSALESAISEDRDAGCHPMCIVGNAGTINTGAFDDLDSVADICQRERMWFHVDGAFGAWAALSPELRPLVAGMDRADSLACDLHKWMYMPYEIGCALVRKEEAHRRSFSLIPTYLTHAERGLAAGEPWFSDYGVQLSRNFRALKAWMSLQAHGVKKYGRLIQQNVDQARYLVELVDASPELELMAPVPLSIVCFRYRASHLDDASLNKLNEELLMRLHEGGNTLCSHVTIGDKYGLRVGIFNHRTRREDLEIFVKEVTGLGNDLVEEGKER
jgi:aromatic-L-amino-acid decarboxylase